MRNERADELRRRVSLARYVIKNAWRGGLAVHELQHAERELRSSLARLRRMGLRP